MLAVAVIGLIAGIICVAGLYLFISDRRSKRELDQAIEELGKWARFNLYLFQEVLHRGPAVSPEDKEHDRRGRT